jgi:hypothetical protein
MGGAPGAPGGADDQSRKGMTMTSTGMGRVEPAARVSEPRRASVRHVQDQWVALLVRARDSWQYDMAS